MNSDKIASYWTQGRDDRPRSSESKENNESKEMNNAGCVECLLCPHRCKIPINSAGICGVRVNKDGALIASSYGLVSSVALDPIEKKPLYRFHGGKMILSIGSVGCNFRCPFCQNYGISMEFESAGLNRVSPQVEDSGLNRLSPQVILELATGSVDDGNIGVAYTYNEPLISYEFVKDCSMLIKKHGLKNVLVTNGYINEEPLVELLPYIDAMNIDIKGGAGRTYNVVGGTRKYVERTLELAYGSCHIEATTLVIPEVGESDVEGIAKLLASIDRKIPYHISRFFPRYKYKDHSPTPIETMYKMKTTAEKHLEYVYLGNV